MDKEVLDLYTDYLISSFGLTTATGLSALLDGALSHDRVSRFLSKSDLTSADLWHWVKPLVRKVQRDDGVLINQMRSQYTRLNQHRQLENRQASA